MVLALCVTTGACLVVVGLSRIGARRRRRAIERRGAGTAPRQPVPGDVIAVDEPARALRRRGYVLLAVQIAAMDALVVGVLAILGTIELPVWVGVVIAVGGIGGALVVTAVAARRELGAIAAAAVASVTGGAPRSASLAASSRWRSSPAASCWRRAAWPRRCSARRWVA
jgi:hypothetical protein